MDTSLVQLGRLGDVFVFGPFLLWFAYQARGMPDWARIALAAGGLATIGFNMRNYIMVREVDEFDGPCCELLEELT